VFLCFFEKIIFSTKFSIYTHLIVILTMSSKDDDFELTFEVSEEDDCFDDFSEADGEVCSTTQVSVGG
jgi:hypothetical protein